MQSKIILFLIAILSLQTLAHEAASYDFLKPYNDIKSQLKKLPEKPIQETLFCSRMNMMVDQAPQADRHRVGLKADRIVVSKTRRKLYLFNGREVINEYPVAFGFGSLEGPKSQSSDGRTPEGIYQIDSKKKNSDYHKALHVSYPNDQDKAFARKYGVKAGDSIMIHGFPQAPIDGLDPVLIPQIHPRVDWTQGCIAVTNEQIEEIYSYIEEEATVEICPLEAEIKTPAVEIQSLQIISGILEASDTEVIPVMPTEENPDLHLAP